MAVYRGVVKGNTVVLEESSGLPDGAIVEVRAVARSLEEEREREEAFLRHLLEIGMTTRIPQRLPDPPGLDRTLIELDGPPLSQTIIEERRSCRHTMRTRARWPSATAPRPAAIGIGL
jgi:hypothetical protein